MNDQQEEAQRRRDRTPRPGSADTVRRRSLELARLDLLKRIEKAPERLHDGMKAGLAALEAQIAEEDAAAAMPAPPSAKEEA